MVRYIQEEDWAEFEKEFPDAAAFLRRKSLKCELVHLRKAAKDYPRTMTSWDKKRLAELEKWAEDTLKIGGTL